MKYEAAEMILVKVIAGNQYFSCDIIFINNVFLSISHLISHYAGSRIRVVEDGGVFVIKTDVIHHIFHLSLSIIFHTENSSRFFSSLYHPNNKVDWLVFHRKLIAPTGASAFRGWVMLMLSQSMIINSRLFFCVVVKDIESNNDGEGMKSEGKFKEFYAKRFLSHQSKKSTPIICCRIRIAN